MKFLTSKAYPKLNLNIFLNHYMTKSLSDFEKKVLNLYIFGYTYKEIAKEFDKSPKSIDNAINRIKNKLQFLKKEK